MSKEAELEAIEEVSKRCGRLSTTIAAPIFIAALSLCIPLFFVLRDVQGMLVGRYSLRLTLLGAALPPTIIGIFVARFVCKRAVHQRRPTYIRKAAEARGLDPSSIAESFGEWD